MSFGIQYKHTVNGERYVYYQRLFTDAEKYGWDLAALGFKAQDSFDYRISEGSDAKKIAEYFFGLAQNELHKEVRVLSEKFGTDIVLKYNPNENNYNIGKELIEAFNKTLNLQSVFERNLKLITSDNNQHNIKQIITYFASYFQTQFRKYSPQIINEIQQNFDETVPLKDQLLIVLDKYLPICVREALIFMFSQSNAELPELKEYKDAYKDLLPYLTDFTNPKGNSFINSFIEQYRLRDLCNVLIKDVEDLNGLTQKINNFHYSNTYTVHTLGGSAAENLGAFIVNIVADQLGANSNTSTTLTGNTGQKSDFTMTIDLPLDTIENWIENNIFGHREENVRSIKQLQDNVLSKFNNGFIIYTNAKNYTLDDKFKGRGGFSAGEPINLQTWDSLMHIVNQKGRDLIFSAMQLIPGAIGEGNDEKVSMMFARAIALALFDDFNTVGLVQDSSVQNIHLMYLNGIYFPLSFYYTLLARTFMVYAEYSINNIQDLIHIKINYPSNILFPTMKEQRDFEKSGASAWREQQQQALEKIKISYHFMKEFSQIMREVFYTN